MDDFGATILAAILTIALLGLLLMLILGGVLGEYGIDGPGYWYSVGLTAVIRLLVMD